MLPPAMRVNFGAGAKLSLDYVLQNGTRVGAFAGYEWSNRDQAVFGLSLTVPLGGTTGGGVRPGVETLGAHIEHVNTTMQGMPITARQRAVDVEIHSQPEPEPIWLFQTLDGVGCSRATPAPGCTFRIDGTRVSVADDPDYNRTGVGANDLWYVTFDAAGNAAVFNEFGQFQFTASTADFAGFITGTTIGVGTGLYWENVAHGTYWFGDNGILYSANTARANYGLAIN